MTAVGMDHRVTGFLDSRDDGWMVVPQRRAHLTRVEIDILLAVHIGNYGVPCPDEYRSLCRCFIYASAKTILCSLFKEISFRGTGCRRHLKLPRGRLDCLAAR